MTLKYKKGKGKLILTGETTSASIKDAIIKTLSIQGNKLIDSILILPDTYPIRNTLAWLQLVSPISGSIRITLRDGIPGYYGNSCKDS